MSIADLYFRKTRLALLVTSLLNEPFIALYAWLPFILRKELHATAFQVSLLVMLRPVVSLFSFYWSRTGNHKKNLVLAGVLARLPFLCFFWLDNIWFLIFASAVYMLFSRAGIPPWMEILKLNMPQEKRGKLFSLSSALGFAEGIILALGIGALFDAEAGAWKVLFLLSALLGMASVYLQRRLPVNGDQEREVKKRSPWKESLELLRNRPDFAHFQWGFMIGGFGIMLVASALPFLFADVLHLSHLNFGAARCLCMGSGFVLSSPFWGQAINRFAIAPITSVVCAGFALFPALLLLSPYNLSFLYLAYIIYGIAQGGSHIVWHLSGPLFAGKEDSSPFSNVNILTVGLRGLIAPLLGGFICDLWGPSWVLCFGAILCLSGSLVMRVRKQVAET